MFYERTCFGLLTIGSQSQLVPGLNNNIQYCDFPAGQMPFKNKEEPYYVH